MYEFGDGMIKKLLILIFFILAVSANTQPVITDIYTVQQDTTLIGKEVAVVGVVTVTTGIFNLKRTFIEDEDGGPWSGVAIWDNSGEFYAEEGERVRIIGVVYENNGLTEIRVNNFNFISTPVPFPDIIHVNTADIATGSSNAEQYESVLVQVNNISVIDDSLGSGEWLVNDGSGACRIDDEADYLFYDVPEVGTEIASITGILNYSNSNFKLEPRYRLDINDGDSTAIYTIPQVQQNISLIGDTVTVIGVVTASTGVFDPGKTYIEEAGGGPFSGILLYDSTAALNADEGDQLRVTGEVSDNEDMTEILVTSYDLLSTGESLPEVELVTTGDIVNLPFTASRK